MKANQEAAAEKGSKKKTKLPIIIIIFIIIGVAAGVGISAGIGAYNNAQKQAINDEVEAINQIINVEYYEDIDRDALYSHLNNRVAGGKYADVESAAKEYLIAFHDDVFATVDNLDDDRLISALSAENIAEDGPELAETKEYIARLRAEIETAKASCLEKSSSEAIASYAEKYGLKGDALEFYYEIISSSENEIEDSEYIDSLDDMIETLNSVEAALNFLSENADGWKVENGVVYFTTQELLDKYNAICDEIKD